ncbi:hypothetical protein [Pontibacter chitinilyticus]|uniref:hypothetical protein n=1 Tax=Pontibacter chitinilyticus TaxID=2674989 RepID=UPI0032196A39
MEKFYLSDIKLKEEKKRLYLMSFIDIGVFQAIIFYCLFIGKTMAFDTRDAIVLFFTLIVVGLIASELVIRGKIEAMKSFSFAFTEHNILKLKDEHTIDDTLMLNQITGFIELNRGIMLNSLSKQKFFIPKAVENYEGIILKLEAITSANNTHKSILTEVQ